MNYIPTFDIILEDETVSVFNHTKSDNLSYIDDVSQEHKKKLLKIFIKLIKKSHQQKLKTIEKKITTKD